MNPPLRPANGANIYSPWVERRPLASQCWSVQVVQVQCESVVCESPRDHRECRVLTVQVRILSTHIDYSQLLLYLYNNLECYILNERRREDFKQVGNSQSQFRYIFLSIAL